jgi:hypothetical protein
MGPPQGGPEDKVPPVLLATVPESIGSYPEWNRDVEFLFDEVVSEGSTPNFGLGTGDLERLILLSPSKGVPKVGWKRDRLTISPREGWKPNRVYRVELLPGLMDLRRNRLDTSAVLTFSTGGPAPTDTLSGIVIDWPAGRAARQALVELVLLPDSLVYRTVTDSSGRFRVGPLPRAEYIVFGAIDQNKNNQRERRESYDSTHLAAARPAAAPLWLIPRDTLGPRITQVTPNDSVSATVTFSGPLDPYQPAESLVVRLLRQADSSQVPFRSLLPKVLDDSLQRLARAAADSARAAADTARPDAAPPRPPAVKPPAAGAPAPARPGAAAARQDPEVDSVLALRPALYDKLVLRTDSAFQPESRLIVEVLGIRSAAGVAGDARNVLVIPKRVPPPRADSAAVRSDSTARPAADTVPKPAPTP